MDYQKLERLYHEYKDLYYASQDFPDIIEDVKTKLHHLITETMRSYMKDILDAEVKLPINTKNRYEDFVKSRFDEYIDEYIRINIDKNYYIGIDTFCFTQFKERITYDFIQFLNAILKQSISSNLFDKLSKYYLDGDKYVYLFSFEQYIKGLE